MDEKQIEKLVKSRHPSYAENVDHWNFLNDTYEGGRQWFERHIKAYFREGNSEYADRLERAYRFNHTREIVGLVNKYVFKTAPTRVETAPTEIKEFWKNSTLDGASMDQYARRLDVCCSKYGRGWIVVDSTSTGEEVSEAERKKAGARCYTYFVSPVDALNMSFDDHGALNWILIREYLRDDVDPMNSSFSTEAQYRLWTKNEWFLFGLEKTGKKKRYVVLGQGAHGLDEVPVVWIDASNDESTDPYCSPALINDVAYLDRTVARYLSCLDEIIHGQTFSQLCVPASGIATNSETMDGNARDHLVEISTKRVFTFDGSEGGKPFYLSPDPKQAQLILEAIKQIINEIYHSVGVAGERTKQDNSLGIDNSSGVAKAYDFDRVASLLLMKAKALESVENKIVTLVCKWLGVTPPEAATVIYPDTFDVRGINEEIELSKSLSFLGAPDSMQREQMRRLSEKLFADAEGKIKKEIETELKSWPPEPVEVTTPGAGAKAAIKRPTPSPGGTSGK